MLEILVEKGVSIAGRVVDRQGRPVAQAEVEAASDTVSYPFGLRPMGAISTEDGSFVLRGLRPSREYQVVSRHEAFATGRSGWINVGPGQEIVGADVEMLRGVEIGGTVRDPAGLPVNGAEVSAENSSQTGWRTARTDENGHFHFTHLPPDTYSVEVQGDDPGDGTPSPGRPTGAPRASGSTRSRS